MNNIDRYEVRHANGVWHVFDTVEYEVWSMHFGNRRADAVAEAEALNG